jgi:hypothetical protein
MTVQFGDGFYPPEEDSLERVSENMQLSIRPSSMDADQTKFDFIWEIIEFDESSGKMLIQVNFTNAIWISASTDLDDIDLSLLDYEYFIPESRRRLQEPVLEEEIKNFTCNSKLTRQMPNTESS